MSFLSEAAMHPDSSSRQMQAERLCLQAALRAIITLMMMMKVMKVTTQQQLEELTAACHH